MKEMLKYLRRYRKEMVLATVMITISTCCDLLLPTIMSEILNNGVYQRDLDYISKCCIWMLLVAAVGLGSVLMGTKISSSVVASFCADVRGDVFRKVNSMTFEEFGRMGTAALVTRATHDVQTVSWVASELCGTVFMIPVLFLGGVFLAMSKDMLLSLLMLLFVPVITVAVLRISKGIVPLWEKADEYIDKQNSLMRQRLRGIRVIRAFRGEDREHEKIEDAIHVMSESFIRSNIAYGMITPLAMVLLNTAAVLVVYFGGWRMELGSGLTGGDIFAIVQYISLVSSGLIMAAFTVAMFPQARVAADRIGQVLKAEAMSDPVERKDLLLKGKIAFDGVSFCYEGASEFALKDISLEIQPGERVAVIGGTGAGKSTLVSLLLGFRMPTEGRVLLDDMPTDTLSRHSMRENICCALQSATIYSGTIRENVRMGRLNATDAEILDALEAAQAMEFVESLPQGLDHEIKQSGKNLSGGQKQRLSIARALLKGAPVYIFDDSFSALDFLTEANLRKTLAERLRGKTQIIITQRVSSAMHCDKVFVMDRGCLVDWGSHAELLSRCDIYREIYESQTGGGAR